MCVNLKRKCQHTYQLLHAVCRGFPMPQCSTALQLKTTVDHGSLTTHINLQVSEYILCIQNSRIFVLLGTVWPNINVCYVWHTVTFLPYTSNVLNSYALFISLPITLSLLIVFMWHNLMYTREMTSWDRQMLENFRCLTRLHQANRRELVCSTYLIICSNHLLPCPAPITTPYVLIVTLILWPRPAGTLTYYFPFVTLNSCILSNWCTPLLLQYDVQSATFKRIGFIRAPVQIAILPA